MASSKNQNTKLTLFLLLLIFFIYFLAVNISSSVFLSGKDRINVVFYSDTPVFYSFGFQDITYLMPFSADQEIIIPGGYGSYRIGALGKLVSLEGNPGIFKKAFSAATSAFVDLYFYKKGSSIYYGQKTGLSLFPQIKELLTASGNGNFIDRLFLLWYLNIDRKKFSPIDNLGHSFDREEFYKEHKGYFYKKTYRNIKDNVQILYTNSYKTATLIDEIIEGSGIRVVDISQEKNSTNLRCQIITSANKPESKTATDLAKFFGCDVKSGTTEVSDIILILGNLEKTWEVD